jgi:hypothetical protein
VNVQSQMIEKSPQLKKDVMEMEIDEQDRELLDSLNISQLKV